MSDSVRLEVADGVGTIRLDRPPANAIDPELSAGIMQAAREATERDDVRALVVWGGERIFAAGADIKVMAGLDPEGVRPVVSSLGDALEELESVPMITISAINGYALGGGLELALATDFRFAAEDARLGQPEIKIGVFPAAAKASLRAAETDPQHGFAIERDAFCALFGSPDQREGMRAFLEKREARFGASR